MKIIAKNKYNDSSYETDIKSLVEAKVDGSSYDSGELEEMKSTIANQTALLAKIVEKLDLSNEELNDWLAAYDETLTKLE